MLPVNELRHRQEQRLLPALAAWEEAKKSLESAIALAESREREYRDIADDVHRKLDALQTVIVMAQELEESQGVGALEASRTSTPSARPARSGVLQVSSRRLFPANWRSRETSLSILPARQRK